MKRTFTQTHSKWQLLLSVMLFFSPFYTSAQNVVLNLAGMTPHVGQKLEVRLISKRDLSEADRAVVDPVAMAGFSVSLTGEEGEDYFVDFYADLNQNGRYDAPPADHAWRLEANDLAGGDNTLSFNHNTNFTDIEWRGLLTVNFTGMTPHVGQQLGLRLRRVYDGKEVARTILDAVPGADFSVSLAGLEYGRDYYVDFYADLNQNGRYDAPPADHAWQELVSALPGQDQTIDFNHNTQFTNIDWTGQLKLELKSMNPHLGQLIEARLRDRYDGREVSRLRRTVDDPEIDILLPGLRNGGNYMVDFYADLNGNGIYDNPPADHAWRELVSNVEGDEDITFEHNTNFSRIGWRHELVLDFSNMNPHLGQRLEVRVRDLNRTGKEVGRVVLDSIVTPLFGVPLPFLEAGHSYWLDFVADLNKNGIYDNPPADHAWRLTAMNVPGDTTVSFVHNTTFTDIGASGLLTVAFSNMNPHLGQLLELRVSGDDGETGRIRQTIGVPNFAVVIPGIQPGQGYTVDFYADLSRNGIYDAPPADHAWRETVTVAAGTNDASLNFVHNTTFTDINWPYLFTLRAENMNPHVGQLFELRVVNTATSAEIGRFSWPEILVPNFWIEVPGLRIGENYDADFYADFNQNGVYDAPPADHAWRLNFDDQAGDTTLTFEHNTSFTDIMWITTATNEIPELNGLRLFPNPVISDIILVFNLEKEINLRLDLFNSMGQQLRTLFSGRAPAGDNTLRIDRLGGLSPGVYFMKMQSDAGGIATYRVVKR